MFANQRVLFLYAHMDDETISSYGTIRRAVGEGADVFLHCVCGLGRIQTGEYQQKFQTERAETFRLYEKIVRSVSTSKYYDLQLTDAIAQSEFNRVVEAYKPTIVVTHWPGDLHFEHVLLGKAALLSCRRVPGMSVRQLWYTSSPVSRWAYGQMFSPNLFIDISRYEHTKAEMLERYSACEIPYPPDLRSADAIMMYDKMNGAAAGVGMAESYIKVFEVD